jgi:hypothetical protein
MGTKMTHTARAELTSVVRRRYSVATGAQKRKILDEFIAVTGYHEKSAIRALNAEPTVKKQQTRVRTSLYDEAARAALIVLWEASDRVCGKRLRALLPILLPALGRPCRGLQEFRLHHEGGSRWHDQDAGRIPHQRGNRYRPRPATGARNRVAAELERGNRAHFRDTLSHPRAAVHGLHHTQCLLPRLAVDRLHATVPVNQCYTLQTERIAGETVIVLTVTKSPNINFVLK